MKIIILGITGMLGNALFRVLSQDPSLKVYGTARNSEAIKHFPEISPDHIIAPVYVDNIDMVRETIESVKPDAVINAIGLVKQLSSAEDPLSAIPINSLLPHQLAAICKEVKARFIHISTDCVFSGKKGKYLESDLPDAYDLYGRSKLLGEVTQPHTVTLRTSIIGHELNGGRSLVNWFLSQEGRVKGFTKAIFSGLPTVELARVIRDYVLPNPELHGLYHVASTPIDKNQLLQLVAKVYDKDIVIDPSDELVIDRSLNADKFHSVTGYVAPPWPELIASMHAFR